MVTTDMLHKAEIVVEMARNDSRVDTKPILRWENAPYSNGKEKVADIKLMCPPETLSLGAYGNVPSNFRYHVRRSSPRSRAWQAKRNGEYFDKAVYSSMEAAMKACEEDALSPKSSLRKQDMGIGDLATAN